MKTTFASIFTGPDLFCTIASFCSYFYPHDAMRKRGLCRRKMAGWMDAHHAGIVSTAKPIYILKLFRPSGSPIILVSSDPCAGTKFQGNPFSGALNTQGGINWRFSTKINVYLGNGTT